MATKTDFTEQEWITVSEAPQLAAAAVMVAGASGFFGSIKEAMAAGERVLAGRSDTNPLIQAISAKDEVQAMQTRFKERLKSTDSQQASAWLAGEAVASARKAMWILGEKAPEDVADYRRWVMAGAVAVANAAKEGGFLGFGGERVSEPEAKMLNELRVALGIGAS